MWEHRLLERCERPRLDDVGGDGAGQSRGDQRRQPAREREHGAGDGHRDEEKAVRAAAAEAVAVTGEQDGDERSARQQSCEHDADLGGGQTAARERDTDQDGAEPVGCGARSLAGDDPACV